MNYSVQITSDEHLFPLTIWVEQLEIDGRDIGSAQLQVKYDDSGCPILVFTDLIKYIPKKRIFDFDIKLRYRRGQKGWPILITKRQLDIENNKYTFEGQFLTEPVTLQDDRYAKRFEAVILTAAQFRKIPIELQDSKGARFVIKPARSIEDTACVVSGELPLTVEDSLNQLNELRTFINFVKGSYSGFGNLIGYDENNEVSFRNLGFSASNFSKRQTNWFDIEVQSSLPDIFLKFSEARNDRLLRKVLDSAISYYIASNNSRDISLEMSVISTHAALEVIVKYILEHRDNWPKSKVANRKIAFSVKHKAAFERTGSSCNLMEFSPILSERSDKGDKHDVFGLISFFRNKLVHHNLDWTPTGIELHEVWLLSQWLVEYYIFFLIGYEGTVIDRRIYNGWRGTTYKIQFGAGKI